MMSARRASPGTGVSSESSRIATFVLHSWATLKCETILRARTRCSALEGLHHWRQLCAHWRRREHGENRLVARVALRRVRMCFHEWQDHVRTGRQQRRFLSRYLRGRRVANLRVEVFSSY